MVTLDPPAKKAIMDAITEAERMTSGEIRVHLQKKCKDDVMYEAKKVFRRLKMHKTKHHNAVLIFIAMESRRFAILGDSGVHHHVGGSYWTEIRDKMASHFVKGEMLEGIIVGVLSVGEKLKAHFPLEPNDRNELPNEITKS
ncbi:MAG: hypothetical protein AUJ72_06100 [Candidatus Omnitrophica bacterium CG1_02_46_14]|nr:MAG: hypothetical protein AUJ72_06100 [Candidatus Omnitrophica bacterium CG1_02_46_14]